MAFLFYKINNIEEDEAKPEYIKFKKNYYYQKVKSDCL